MQPLDEYEIRAIAIRDVLQFAIADGLAKYLRERAGLTQQQVADEIGATKGEVSRWERGARLPLYAGKTDRYYRLLKRLVEESTDA